MIISRGLTVADLDKMTYGMLINYSAAYDRQKLRAAGKEVVDPEIQYQELKANFEIVKERYKKGLIPKERFEEYERKLRTWEAD